MSSVEVLIPILNITVQFYVGKNANQNSDIVRMAKDEDLWFHVEGHPSCHVIAIMPSDVDRKKVRYIVNKALYYVSNILNSHLIDRLALYMLILRVSLRQIQQVLY